MKITQEMKELYEKSLVIPPKTNTKKLLFDSWLDSSTYGKYYLKVVSFGERPESPEFYESYINEQDKKCLCFYEKHMELVNSINH